MTDCFWAKNWGNSEGWRKDRLPGIQPVHQSTACSKQTLEQTFRSINLSHYLYKSKYPFLKKKKKKIILELNYSFALSADPRRKYHVRLLAYNNMEEGYQADQTVSTPGCVCKCCRCMKNLLRVEVVHGPSSSVFLTFK